MSIWHAIILAIIEGLTEFLPVSSTGHMIVASAIMGIDKNDFVKLFEIAIQLGAILSVVVLYFKRFFKSVGFYLKLMVAFIPAAVLGVLFSDKIDELLESPMTVAVMLLVGGVILLFVDKWFSGNTGDKALVTREEDISYMTAFKIGFFQCLAMIPGVSRSAASIVGGMSQRLSRTAAAEFSFFLAVPTMFGATAKKLYSYIKDGHAFTGNEIQLLAVGNVVAFIVAMLAIRTFITYLEKHGFRLFGWYRIIIGLILIIAILTRQDISI